MDNFHYFKNLLLILFFSVVSCNQEVRESKSGKYISYDHPLGEYIGVKYPKNDSGNCGIAFTMNYEHGITCCNIDTVKKYDNLTCKYEGGEISLLGTVSDSKLQGLLRQFDVDGNLLYETNYLNDSIWGGSSTFSPNGELEKYIFSLSNQQGIFFLGKDHDLGYKFEMIKGIDLPLAIIQSGENPYSVGETVTLNIWAADPPRFSSEVLLCVDSSFNTCTSIEPHKMYKEMHMYTLSSEYPGVFPLFLGYVLLGNRNDTLIKGITRFEVTFVSR